MKVVVNSMYINLLLTCVSVIFFVAPTMADVNTNQGIKPMVTSGYRMFSSIHTQHVVSVRILEEIKFLGDNHMCGGTIISPRRVLTAAHCIESPLLGLVPAKAITVCAGSPLRVTRTGEERWFNVSKAVVHPDYSIDPVYADIAYLILSEAVQEVEDAIKIALMAEETPKTGTLCTAVGWGRVFEAGPMPDEILHVDLHIWDKMQCLDIQQNMKDGIFCAGDLEDRGKGTCHGDSGGPIFCNGKLTGIVSYGIGCGWSEVAADFYMDVPYYVSWVNIAVKQCGFPTILTFINVAYFSINKFFF